MSEHRRGAQAFERSGYFTSVRRSRHIPRMTGSTTQTATEAPSCAHCSPVSDPVKSGCMVRLKSSQLTSAVRIYHTVGSAS